MRVISCSARDCPKLKLKCPLCEHHLLRRKARQPSSHKRNSVRQTLLSMTTTMTDCNVRHPCTVPLVMQYALSAACRTADLQLNFYNPLSNVGETKQERRLDGAPSSQTMVLRSENHRNRALQSTCMHGPSHQHWECYSCQTARRTAQRIQEKVRLPSTNGTLDATRVRMRLYQTFRTRAKMQSPGTGGLQSLFCCLSCISSRKSSS